MRSESDLIPLLFDEYEGVDEYLIALDAENVGLKQAASTSNLDNEEENPEPEIPGQISEHKLAKYGRDLTYLAHQGKLGPIIGRREEIKNIGRILTQRSRNNPLLLGDPGVGKTAIVEGLAIYAAREDAIEQTSHCGNCDESSGRRHKIPGRV